jgi:membrane associated rhomboid family serine protease
MQQVNEHPLVAVLLRIAREAPNPWFFRAGMERTPEAEQQVAALVEVLEVLHREGLVARHAAPSPLVGPGVSLTEKGRKAVLDPEARRKLAEGEPLDPNDVGSRVRASVRGSLTPWLTRALVLASVGAFVTGGVFAWSRGFFQAFLTGYPSSNLDFYRYLTLLNQMGSMNGKALLDGQWWRMGASSFLHLGGLHLLMNMWALWNIGSFDVPQGPHVHEQVGPVEHRLLRRACPGALEAPGHLRPRGLGMLLHGHGHDSG